MAIKLYKSQLTPTTDSSNVLDQRQISLSEAQSIGKAWKGMVQSGEKLYAKHLDIKSDNELLEKSKEIMNGNDNFEGLSFISIKAKEMKDPDKAVEYYNTSWKSLLDQEKNNLSWMAKRKFTNWMNRQNLKDTNSIKVAATTNMINGLRTNTLDKIETLKKSIIYSVGIEQETAKTELAELLSNTKTKELFGKGLDAVVKSTNRDVAFYLYKNVPIADQAAALAAAKKDDRLEVEDVEKLKTHFKTAKSANNHLNKDNVKKMEKNLENGIWFNQEELNEAYEIAATNGDNATLIKIKNMIEDAPIYAQLSTMSVADIENRVNILTEYKNKKREGMELNYARNLEISKKYLANLTTALNKDQLMTGHDKGIVAINEIGFEELLTTGNVKDFTGAINERIAKAKTVAAFYKRPVVFFTANEKKAIESAFASATNSEQIIRLSTALVDGFGTDSDIAFRQLSKDNTFLSTVGGLTLMNDNVPGSNVQLAVEGYLISKEPELAKTYVMKSSDTDLIPAINEFAPAFNENLETFNNLVEVANYIYAAQLKNKGKTTEDFDDGDWKDAFFLAAGGNYIEKFGFDKKMGGFDEDTRGTMVHIPSWLPNGSFDNVIERFKADRDGYELFKKASSNGELPVVNGEKFFVDEVFKDEDPYFVSVGNGKYKVAIGENPLEFGSEPNFLMNSDGGFFIININQIRNELITGLK